MAGGPSPTNDSFRCTTLEMFCVAVDSICFLTVAEKPAGRFDRWELVPDRAGLRSDMFPAPRQRRSSRCPMRDGVPDSGMSYTSVLAEIDRYMS